mgnify:CR=1 FL=1
MKYNFFSGSSILKKFLVFNLIIFFVLSVFTFLYLNAIKPNLIKNRSNQHLKIIDNTTNHIDRLSIEFTKEGVTKFLLDERYLFHIHLFSNRCVHSLWVRRLSRNPLRARRTNL